jgi:hypothetical protein
MNTDQLMESLSENAPDPDHVLASFSRKRRAARNRMYAASGGLAVAAAVVVAGVLLHGAGPGGASTTASGAAGPVSGRAAVPAAGPALGPAGFGFATGSASAASCDAPRLQAELAQAVRNGASVIVGYATLASGSGTVAGGGSGAPAYYSLSLRSVRTLAGPTVRQGTIAWIARSSRAASASPGSAASEELFGIVSPSATSGAPGPVLQAAPIANGQVLLSGAACWDITGSGSLHGFATINGPTVPATSRGATITEIPLATAENLAAEAR